MKTKAQTTFEKLAYWAPFKNTPETPYDCAENYLKEYGNRLVGGLGGALVGTGIGAALGAPIGMALGARSGAAYKHLSPILGKNTSQALLGGALMGGWAGGTLGGITGVIGGGKKSLNLSERDSGLKETGWGKHLLRGFGATAVGGMGGPLAPITIPLADYVISRKLAPQGPLTQTN